MIGNAVIFPEPHYHIRWLASGTLDWERHDTRPEAEQFAKQLSRADEKYVIEQFDDRCGQCQKVALAHAHKRTFDA